MMLTALFCLLQGTAVEAPLPFPPATPESQGISAEALAELDGIVARYVDKGWVVGAELLVIKNCRTVLHEVHGWRDRDEERPMEKETICNLRSMAKPFVGMATQLLALEGKLSLTDPVAKHLSSFDHGASAEITVEHLLTHRSGLPDGHPTGRREDYPDLRSVAAWWGAHGPTEFAPGEGFGYSDPGLDVLGALLAEVSGESLEALVTKRLFQPLGMASTFAMTDAEDPRNERIASDYRLAGREWKRYWKRGDGPLSHFVHGAGTTWYGSPRDYARFMAVWMDGGKPCLPEGATQRALEPISRFESYDSEIPGIEVWYGQTWIVYVDEDQQRVGFGHSGSDGTYAYCFPEQDLMIFYFTQSRGQKTRLRLEKVFGKFLS